MSICQTGLVNKKTRHIQLQRLSMACFSVYLRFRSPSRFLFRGVGWLNFSCAWTALILLLYTLYLFGYSYIIENVKLYLNGGTEWTELRGISLYGKHSADGVYRSGAANTAPKDVFPMYPVLEGFGQFVRMRKSRPPRVIQIQIK